MSLRSFYRLSVCAAALSVVASLGACSGRQGAAEAYTGPGWYLERSYIIVVGGPKVYGGPFSYEKCEEERLKLGPEVSPEMLCVNHPGKPKRYGLY
ncbi:hypothetical protein [Reyranella sp.]|uniref:hypothetical protein n=1 Tax=Reyranella sp. TaxID=1929291 RepID=UPI001214D438|nr:hypothetical protein [Reyranella sp.]TAJ84118.1 MAG: hypothetical protein EPO50_21395 [Reyranella sp.]